MAVSKECLDVLKKHRADVCSLNHNKVGNLLDFMTEKKLWKANITSVLNTTLMSASVAKLIGLTKNGWLKLLSAGLIATVNFSVLHEKYKVEFDEFVKERKEVVNKYWFQKLSNNDIVAIIEDGLRVLTILQESGEVNNKLKTHWMALESQSIVHWDQFHINHFWGFVKELEIARKKIKLN